MDKLLLKMISSLIKDLDKRDYIASVKYVIYLITKILYFCRLNGLEILEKDIHSFKATQLFSNNNKNIFKEICSFTSSRVITLLMDMFVMFIIVTVFKGNDKIGKLVSQVIVTIGNYILSKLFVFKGEKIEK